MAEASEVVVELSQMMGSVGLGLDEIDADKRDDLKAWREDRAVGSAGNRARKGAW